MESLEQPDEDSTRAIPANSPVSDDESIALPMAQIREVANDEAERMLSAKDELSQSEWVEVDPAQSAAAPATGIEPSVAEAGAEVDADIARSTERTATDVGGTSNPTEPVADQQLPTQDRPESRDFERGPELPSEENTGVTNLQVNLPDRLSNDAFDNSTEASEDFAGPIAMPHLESSAVDFQPVLPPSPKTPASIDDLLELHELQTGRRPAWLYPPLNAEESSGAGRPHTRPPADGGGPVDDSLVAPMPRVFVTVSMVDAERVVYEEFRNLAAEHAAAMREIALHEIDDYDFKLMSRLRALLG